MMLDFNKGAPALYSQIKELLKEKIESGEYMPGDVLPSELEIQSALGVSRITVRQAINELANEGYVCRTRGKGTIVLTNKIEEQLNRIMSFSDEMKERGLKSDAKFARIGIVKLNRTIAMHLGLNQGHEAYKIERLINVNKIPMVFFITYLRKELNLPLKDTEYMGSLYELLKVNNNLTVTKAKDTYEAVAADEYISEFLGIDIYTPVLKRTRVSYDNNGENLEYTICYYRADRYKYSIELGY